MTSSIYSIKIGGEAGQGIKSTSLNLTKVALRSGYHVMTYSEYPSLIRGGHNVVQLVFSAEVVTAPIKPVNFLIALDSKTIAHHQSELVDGAGIVYEASLQTDTPTLSNYKLFPIPLNKLAKEVGGTDIVANTVAVGATLSLLGADLNHFLSLLKESLGSKGDEVVKINQSAAQSGYDYATTNFPHSFQPLLAPIAGVTSSEIVTNGNEAITLGAIAAGLQFASIYPMTPITAILENLAKYQEKYGYIYKQPEDEIAAINMAIGASYAGARSLVATSGGGFCLMSEGYGLAGMTETPLVIIEGMRGGPATGLPTWTEQSDLRLVLHAHQGDLPRIVLAAADAQDAFHLTMLAFNLADIYQTPVIVLVDKNICENDQSFPEFNPSSYVIDRGKTVTILDPHYQRYVKSADGISPRAFPGSGNFFVTNSDEHDQTGYSNEEALNRDEQMTKRLQKLATVAQNHMTPPELIGPPDADLTIISWGSTKGSVLAALKSLPNVNLLQLTWLNPFPAAAVKQILSKSKIILNIENNSTGTAGSLITQHTGIPMTHQLLKNNGRPIYPEEIIAEVRKIQTTS